MKLTQMKYLMKFINLFCSEIQNTRQWGEFKDYQRLLYSSYQAIRMGGKFSMELSMTCISILSIVVILKLLSQRYSICKIYKMILDLQFVIIGVTVLVFFVLPSMPTVNNEVLNQDTNNFKDLMGTLNNNFLQTQSGSYGSIAPIAAAFSSQVESYIQLNDVLFVQQRPVLLVHVLRQFIIILHFTSIQSGYLLREHLFAGLQLTCAILIQMYIDISLQYSDEGLKLKDIKVMKTIHDLKNPIIVISQTLNDEDLDLTDKVRANAKQIINNELTELDDMLETLRTEFKSRNHMEIKELPHKVDSLQFACYFKQAFKKLTENGGNFLQILSIDNFPQSICIQKSNVKRIVNNLISNALKHTMNGFVKVFFNMVQKSMLSTILSDKDPNLHVQPKNFKPDRTLQIENQFVIEVTDNGSGISKSELSEIFNDKQTDECDYNWDGTGLGLSICSYICSKIDAFIIYKSTPNCETVFKVYIPDYSKRNNTQLPEEQNTISINQCVKVVDKSTYKQGHICKCVQIAEDNPNILSKYQKILQKRNIPFKGFDNGKMLQDYLNNFSCVSCHEILVLTDLNMPQMDGKELAIELRKLEVNSFQNIRIVLISAEEQNNSDSLFDKVFYKPIIPQNLAGLYSEFQNQNKDSAKKASLYKRSFNNKNNEMLTPFISKIN